MNRRLLFIVNVDWFFLSHRLPIALEAMRQGYEVHIAVSITNRLAELSSYGFTVHPLTISRGRTSIKNELITFLQVFRLLKQIRPDVVHLVTIKPVLFGGIAARLTNVRAVIAAISGLGFVFVDDGYRAKVRRLLVGGLYRLALGRSNLKVIFQNSSDRDCLARLARLPSHSIEMIRGSGVDLSRYLPTPLPQGIPVVVMASRLITDKGVWEFVQAARLLRERGILARFCLVGTIDPDNPASLTNADLDKLHAEGVVELWGQRTDMEKVLAQAHVMALPSYYGEGLPKVLIEAAACGRAIVTTDMPGCRDAVEPGKTGLLVPAHDALALANALQYLLSNSERCAAMGQSGRDLAEREFNLDQVVARHVKIYDEMLGVS